MLTLPFKPFWVLFFTVLLFSQPAFSILHENEYSIEELKALLSQHGEKSVDELIPVFQEKLPQNLRSRYLLVHRTRSLQFGSVDYPRMILFADDAKFIMALTGHPTENGADGFEAIQYNDKKEAFDFYRIKNIENEWTFEENPKVCKTCHTEHARPNFEGYNLWPGAYGAVDDKIQSNSVEGIAFKKFISENAYKGRYRFLNGLPTAKDLEGKSFLSISTNKEIYSHIYSDHWFRDQDVDYRYKNYPRSNYKFTQEVGRLSVRKFVQRLRRLPDYKELEPAILAAFSINPAPLKDLPLNLVKNPGLDYQEYKKKVYKDVYTYRIRVIRETLKFLKLPEDYLNELEKRIFEKTPLSPLGEEVIADYASLNFSTEDIAIGAHLLHLFDTVGVPLDLKEIGSSHSFKGYSFTFGNNGLPFVKEAIEYFKKNPNP